MRVTEVHKFRTYKIVRLTLDATDCERDIRLAALAAAGEDTNSTFGVQVTYLHDGFVIPFGDDTTIANEATVITYTD